MLWVPDHVGADDIRVVQFLDDMGRGHADGADEEFGAFFDYYVDEFVQLAVGVVVAGRGVSKLRFLRETRQWGLADFVFLALPPTCGRARSTPNGKFLSARLALISWMMSRICCGV